MSTIHEMALDVIAAGPFVPPIRQDAAAAAACRALRTATDAAILAYHSDDTVEQCLAFQRLSDAMQAAKRHRGAP